MTKTIPLQIVTDAQQGDIKALEMLVTEAEKIVRRIAYQFPSADTDDVVQNTLIRLMESIGQLTDPRAFPAWVKAIARNEILMFHRSTNRREQAQMQFGFEPTFVREQDLSPDFLSAISRLPSSQQLIINQLYVAGHSYAEIAVALELPISAVKSRLHRARNRLKKEMNMQSTARTIPLNTNDIESLHYAAQFRHQGEDRQNLSGIYLDGDGYVIGTDGHHLVMRSVPALKTLEANIVIDPTSLGAIDDNAELSVHMDEVQLQMTTDKIALDIRTEPFPDYHAILPTDQPTSCTVNRSDFSAKIKAASADLDKHSGTTRTVLLILDLEQQQATIESNAATSPDAKLSKSYRTPVESPSNRLGILRIALNIDLLMDCLEAVEGEVITLKGSAWNKPLDIVGETHRTILMPIKL